MSKFSLNVESAKPHRRREEATLQTQLMAALDWMLPADAFAFHCPNGGSRNVIEAVNLKRQGVKAGVPDVIIIHRGRPFGLELKARAGRLNDAQHITFRKLQAAGMRIEVARSLSEALDLIKQMGVNLKSKENITFAVKEIFQDARKRRVA